MKRNMTDATPQVLPEYEYYKWNFFVVIITTGTDV